MSGGALPINVNNPFTGANIELRSEGGKTIFYMYCLRAGNSIKFVYHDPDTLEWYTIQGSKIDKDQIKNIKIIQRFKWEDLFDKHAKGGIQYPAFADIFHIKHSAKEIKTEKRIKTFLAKIGVDPKDNIILRDALFSEKGKLKFGNYEIAKEFFRRILYDISFHLDYKRNAQYYMKFYFDLLRRFDSKNLQLDMNNFIPDNTGFNYRNNDFALAFQQRITERYRQLMQEYASRIKVFPELWENKPFRTWKNPKEQNAFFQFCKDHIKGNYGKFCEKTLSEKERFHIFSAEIEKEEIKMDLAAYDAACFAVKECGFLYPAPNIKKLLDFAEDFALGAHNNPKKTAEFYAKHKDKIKKQELVLLELPKLCGGSFVVIKNTPKVKKEFDALAKRMNASLALEEANSHAFLKKLDLVNESLNELDKVVSPIVISLANNPKLTQLSIFKCAERAGVPANKFIYLTLRSIYVQFRMIAVIHDIEYIPLSWPSFISILQDIPGALVNLFYGLFSDNEVTVVDSISIIAAMFFEARYAVEFTKKGLKFVGSKVNWAPLKKMLMSEKTTWQALKEGVISEFKAYFKSDQGRIRITQMKKTVNLLKNLPQTAKVRLKLKTGGAKARLSNGRAAVRGAGGTILGTALIVLTPMSELSAEDTSEEINNEFYGIAREINPEYYERYKDKPEAYYAARSFFNRNISDKFSRKYPLIDYAGVYTEFALTARDYTFTSSDYEKMIAVYINARRKTFALNPELFFRAYKQYKNNPQKFAKLMSWYAELPREFHVNYVQYLKLDLEGGEGKKRLLLVLNDIEEFIKTHGAFNRDQFMEYFKKKHKFFPMR